MSANGWGGSQGRWKGQEGAGLHQAERNLWFREVGMGAFSVQFPVTACSFLSSSDLATCAKSRLETRQIWNSLPD